MHGVRRALLEKILSRFVGMNANLLCVPLLDPLQARTKAYLKPCEVEDAKQLMTETLIEILEHRSLSVGPSKLPAFLSTIRTRQDVIDRYDARLYGIEPRR